MNPRFFIHATYDNGDTVNKVILEFYTDLGEVVKVKGKKMHFETTYRQVHKDKSLSQFLQAMNRLEADVIDFLRQEVVCSLENEGTQTIARLSSSFGLIPALKWLI